jgi:DNA-binding NarL/FixJ family response regulator
LDEADLNAAAPWSAAPTIRVLLVDDNLLAAQALERFFRDRTEFRLTSWVKDAQGAIDHAVAEQSDIVLLDLDMPGEDTLALLPGLQAVKPGVKVIMFSGHCRASEIDRSLNAGACGYICKDEPTAIIVDLLRRAANGECVLSPLAESAFLGHQ